MRMIAGPNGSGKSTVILDQLEKRWLGRYINPDALQKGIEATRSLCLIADAESV